MRVVWELDNWKQNEEAKFKIEMKQKEIEYMNKVVEKWNKYENERERTLKTHELNFEKIETKLKAKMTELQKRENKIALFESEMQTKMAGVANELVAKNREIDKLNSDHEVEVQKLNKSNKELERKLKRLEEQLEQKNQALRTLKEEIETHPVSQLKSEIEEKNTAIERLHADIQKYGQLKDEYKKYTTELQLENDNLKKECEKLKNQTNKDLMNEIKQLKLRLYDMNSNDRGTNLSEVKKEFAALKEQQFQDKHGSKLPNAGLNQKQLASNSEVSRLMQERDFLINLGLDEGDPMVKDIQMALSKYDFGNN